MPTIPIYQQRTSLGQAPNLGRVSTQAATAGAQAVGAVVEGVSDIWQKKQNEDAKTYIGNSISDAQLTWREEVLKRQEMAEPGAPNFTPNLLKDFDEYAEKTIEAAPNKQAKLALRESMQEYRTRLGEAALSFESSSRITKRYNDTVESIDKWALGLTSAPNEENLSEAMGVIEQTLPDVGAENKTKLRNYARKQLTQAMWTSRIEQDPAKVVAELDRVFGKKAKETLEPKEAIDFVIDIEGGFVADDAGAGPTKFGINQTANPDIDIKGLTKERAKEIYKERYWDKINADKLPPAVAMFAFDTAVNMGVSFAKEMLADSGGDVEEMARIRAERYEEIAVNPEKEPYLKGWLARVDKVKQKALSQQLGKVNQAEKVEGTSGLVRMTEVSDLISYKTRAETELKQRQAVAIDSLKTHVTDAVAMAKKGIPDPDPLPAATFSLLGDDGQAALKSYNASQRMARSIGRLKEETNADILKIIAGGKDVATPGAGYAIESEADTAIKKAALAIYKLREEDPAAFVTKNVESVRKSLELINDDMTIQERTAATQTAINESLAAQKRLGIQNPRVLTENQVTAYGDKIMQATNPQDVSDFVAGIEMEFGQHNFRKVMGELMKADKLPPALLVIPDLPSAGARDLVAATAFAKLDQLKAGVDKGDVTLLNDRVTEEIADLANTIPVVEMGAVSVLQAYQETTTKLALQMMQRGVSVDDAVTRATKMLWGHYELDGTIRKPATVTFDVEEKAVAKVEMDMMNYDVPPDLFKARDPVEAAEEWMGLIQNHARFYTNPEGTGVQLWAQGMDGALYRVTKGGKQVNYSFDELETTNTKQIRPEIEEPRLRREFGRGPRQ